MNSSRNTWTAVVLCCLVWFVYMRWFAPVPPQNQTSTENTPVAAASNSGQPPKEATGTGQGLVHAQIATTESQRAEGAKTIVTLSDVGGKVNTVQLKNYTETIKSDSPGIYTLAPALSPDSGGTFFTDETLAGFSTATYQRKADTGIVEFTTANKGVELTKTYQVPGDDYYFSTTYHLKFPDATRKDWGFLLIPVGAKSVQYDAKTPLNSWEAVMYQNESVTRRNWEKIPTEPEVKQGNTGWVAFGNRYFSTALINRSEINPDVVFSKGSDLTGVYLRYPLVLKEGQTELTFAVDVYSGPKDSAYLGKVAGLKQLIDYGMFSFFAYPLLDLLRFFFRFIHNYGIAIILLTIVVRLLFWPLSVKSFKSMKQMQKLQPQINALKEKYKDDPQRFGQEQMALFKTHKVNPAGGCVPMLVQLPVFIALYAVLGNSIELFHAPFFGWILDLSSKDPFYIFPILMGISMLLQQRLTPAAGMDPTQQKVMMIMPVVFTFIMINLPSGLTIYIFLSTILGVLQQWSMNREGTTPTPGLVATTPGGR